MARSPMSINFALLMCCDLANASGAGADSRSTDRLITFTPRPTFGLPRRFARSHNGAGGVRGLAVSKMNSLSNSFHCRSFSSSGRQEKLQSPILFSSYFTSMRRTKTPFFGFVQRSGVDHIKCAISIRDINRLNEPAAVTSAHNNPFAVADVFRIAAPPLR